MKSSGEQVIRILFMLGCVVATLLVGLLLLTLMRPSLRLWPTPGAGSWQSYLFWPLFRSLNVLCFVIAALTYGPDVLALAAWLRVVAIGLLVVSVAFFVHSFFLLGRDNSYGAQDGLVTTGIYRWTRNPQNATLIVVYACLAVAANSAATYILCAAMILAYVLMVFAEEPWLAATYGETYRDYCARVPRFFSWRRAAVKIACAVSGRWSC
jgi:protein-S-isoprenylcysteine O-methyltransferase Ste14